MNRDRNRDNGGGESRDRGESGMTRTGETAQRARGFFERAADRVREAARDIGQRTRGRERSMRGGYEDRDEAWFGRHETERMMNRMGRDQGYGGREPHRYGDEQWRSRERGYGMRDEYVPRTYGGRDRDFEPQRGREPETYRESAREFGRDWARAHYGRGRDDERGIRGNLGGGYGMRDERGTVRDYMRDWGDRDRGGYGGYGGSQYMRRDDRDYERDRDEDRWGRDDRPNRDRRW